MLHNIAHLNRFLPQQMIEHSNTQKEQEKELYDTVFDKEDDEFKVGVFHKAYNIPTANDMLIIVPFFNPCNSVRLVHNLLHVKNKLEQANIPFVIIHCLFPNSVAICKPSETYEVVMSNSYAFVKENLANIVIRKNITKYTKFLIHDGDVLFHNADWYDKVSTLLNNADIVQPYEKYKCLNANFKDVTREGICMFKACVVYHGKRKERRVINTSHGHPGFLIAFTNTFWSTHGYPDETLIGGGDTLICSIALRTKIYENHHNAKYIDYLYNKYCNDEEVKTNFVQGMIYHMYHGESQRRQYNTRYNLLNKYINEETGYATIDDIVYKNKDGVYEWIDAIRDDINTYILNYFMTRQDDEVPTTS